jgi:hypothetical protein
MTVKITEHEFLMHMFAETLCENFGTMSIQQYYPLAEKLVIKLQEYADKTATLKNSIKEV